MADKYFFIFLSVLALGGSEVWISSEITKPKLTDPIAQRIWAATHGNVSLTSSGASKLIKDATISDSLSRKNNADPSD